jgi:hypothetical protein
MVEIPPQSVRCVPHQTLAGVDEGRGSWVNQTAMPGHGSVT